MRLIPVVFLIATAGCLWAADELTAPVEETTWHMSSEVITEPGFCGDCHYGLTEFWLADWTPDEGNWSLTVRPRYEEAPLYAVQVADAPVIEASGWQSEAWRLGDTHTWSFDVQGADHVLVKAYGSGPEQAALDVTANRQDVVETALTLTSPTGQTYQAEGPEQDLRIVTAPAEDGAWTASVTFIDGAPEGFVHTHHEALAGDVVPYLAPRETATFHVPANETGAPVPTTLRIQPHHDHALFQNTDWDPYDSTAFTVHFTPVQGPAPAPKEWNRTEIDAFWSDDEYLFHAFSGSFQGAYLDQPGHNDAGFRGGYPGFSSPDGDPVLPGTGHVRIELSWTPATSEPALGVKMSPAHWPYFLYPEATFREPGLAVFEVPIAQTWWESPDQTLEWLEPGVVRSYYDIAPYIAEDGELHAVAIDWNVSAYAVR